MTRFFKISADIVAKLGVLFVLLVVMLTQLDKSDSRFDFFNRIYVTDVVPNYLWGFVAQLLFGCLYLCSKKSKKGTLSKRTIVMVQLVLFVVQILFVSQIFFYSGNDLRNVLTGAQNYVDGIFHVFFNEEYFQMCPNNLALYVVYIAACQIARVFGCNVYILLIGMDVILANLAVLFIQLCIREMSLDRVTAIISYVVSIILVGLSPWIVVPYTDMLSVCFSILSLYLYLRLRKREMNVTWKVVFIAIVPAIAYQLKVLNLIVLIGILLAEILFLQKKDKPYVGQAILGVVVVIALTTCFSFCVKKVAQYTPDEDKQLSIEWFLLLGTNDSSYGQWNRDDYELAVVQPQTKEERQELAYGEIGNRLQSYGVTGWLKHFKNKTHIFYNDSSFGWCIAKGSVYQIPETTSSITQFMRQIFFPPDNYSMYCDVTGYGKYYMYYSMLCQCVWMVILCALCRFVWRPLGHKTREELVLEITWIGVFLFSMLFETSARLLISYLPIFIVMMAKGLQRSKRA